MIEIQDLYKYYGERKAVGPLSFSIEPGEIVGLLGLNGAGKTTTLRILACDLLPSSGSVRVDGLDVVDHPHEVRERIGYLPDVPPLYADMTVREYLAFAARLRGLGRGDAERRVAEAIETAHVADVADDPIASLSHGYRQRVGIAQAIVHRPRLLVLDEPISGLDPVQIVEMRELLRSLRGEHTILLSSHILSEISETCDRILVIRDGEIAASGTEAQLSASLLGTFRAEITVRQPAGSYRTPGDERLAKVLRDVQGVSSVEALAPAEPGEGIATYRVEADRDVREALCHAVVGAGGGVLELRRTERELESVFLQLAGPPGGDGKAASREGKPKGKGARRRAAASGSSSASEPAEAGATDAGKPPAEAPAATRTTDE